MSAAATMELTQGPANPWRGKRQLKIDVTRLPAQWTTWEIYNLFKHAGNIHRIRVYEPRTDGSVNAFVAFQPPPYDVSFIRGGSVHVNMPDGRTRHLRYQESRIQQDERQHEHPEDPKQKFPERVCLPLEQINFGVMMAPDTFLALSTVTRENSMRMLWSIDLYDRPKMELEFVFQRHRYKIIMLFTELDIVSRGTNAEDRSTFLITLNAPPLIYRQPQRPSELRATHQDGGGEWNENLSWFRQLKIVDSNAADGAHQEVTQLRPVNTPIDLSRWLTYRLSLCPSTSASDLDLFARVLRAFHGNAGPQTGIKFARRQPSDLYWGVQENMSSALQLARSEASVADLQQMAGQSTELSFRTRYQLEVCLSHHILHECNLTSEFIQKLATMDQDHATKLLEKASDSNKRLCDPMEVFRLQATLGKKYRKVPAWCAVMPAATITPTTVYFHTPVLETSNRVIRTFSRIENGVMLADRFLRVKFTDERYYGKIRQHAATTDLLFAHVKNTMRNGIQVAGRHYEFLAYSSSQFREHCALFFASSASVTADMVREWMGDFQHIPVVAKYASRLGQCLSTTRAMSIRVTIDKIPDIERNGFCFTDGVGKISLFAAQMIAQESGFASSPEDCPSVFQIRMGGAKGILALDPTLKGSVVALRPSQEKFAARVNGVEICRISQFSASFLNLQIILILSSLGVRNEVFLAKLRQALANLELAMIDETKAVEALQNHIDYNHMTPVLAHMIEDGFMSTGDPFMMSCLYLWRSWEIKYLKQKFKILVEKGAFVFGCVDELGILKGHYDGPNHENNGDGRAALMLPEIFLQVSQDKSGNSNVCEVIEGVCILARNPSLHPGDIRVVRAVNVPPLHHLKNCVVLPQTGDRDLANMCSGGDLDGDDYLIMWDPDVIPTVENWNIKPMDYQALPPLRAEGPITVDDITRHYVQFMKNDTLSQIAVQHRFWADREPEGVKSRQCLQLAQLHSKAVDYPKTGHPAELPRNLRIDARPHWSEPKKNSRWYRSEQVLGRLYDAVSLVRFSPDWRGEFDERIINAYPHPSDDLLEAAREVKDQYDKSVQRIMAQFEVDNEFEVWTTFVQRHTDTMGDYKFGEKFGEVVSNLKQQFKDICYEAAGTTAKERDWNKIGPFIAVMYSVTAEQVNSALKTLQQSSEFSPSRRAPGNSTTFKTMPFMSFPWIFYAELGRIANRQDRVSHPQKRSKAGRNTVVKKVYPDFPEGDFVLEPLAFVAPKERVVEKGESMDFFHHHPEVKDPQEHKKAFEMVPSEESGSDCAQLQFDTLLDTPSTNVGGEIGIIPVIRDGAVVSQPRVEEEAAVGKENKQKESGLKQNDKEEDDKREDSMNTGGSIKADDNQEDDQNHDASEESASGNQYVEVEGTANVHASALSRLERMFGSN